MPTPQQRSRSFRKVFVRLPSGENVIHYEKRKNGVAKCALCKKPLRGVKTNEVYKYSKTEKRPERYYGGFICHSCLESLIKKAVRGL